MAKTLLVVDGRGLPRPLTERLGALGYVCLYARGPLRARTLLSQHTVDLILWKDNTGNRDLSGDLFAEWRRHPLIPVVRLYAKGLTAPLRRRLARADRGTRRQPPGRGAGEAIAGGHPRLLGFAGHAPGRIAGQ